MEKEYIAGEPQRYEIGGRVFIVEPRYRKDGESMADILLKLMFADLDEKMRAANKTTILIFTSQLGRLAPRTITIIYRSKHR